MAVAEENENLRHSHNPEEESEEFSLPNLLPQYQNYAVTQEEYIRALEQSVQLLQREIEQLRAQHSPIISYKIDHVPDRQSLEYTLQLIKHSNSEEEILKQIHQFLSHRFPVFESELFLFQNNELHPILSKPDAPIAIIARHFEEEGIIDWVLKNQRTVIIPDIHTAGEDAPQYILVPLLLRGTKIGIFIAQTSATSAEIKAEDLHIFTILAESAGLAIDNIRSNKEIKQINSRLRELNRHLFESAKLASLGELAAVVAHEINNPLHILLGHLQLLESGIGDPRQRINIIKQQVYRIRDITQHLLHLARSEPMTSNFQPVNLSTILTRTLDFLSAQLQRDGISHQLNLKGDWWILGNAVQLEQVFTNLILNARDAMPEGGKLSIAAVQYTPQTVTITIEDSGIGIPEEQLPYIFQPFFTTKPEGKGTGLGLTIVREIVHNHRGTIEVFSELGKGTVVKITFPLVKSEREKDLEKNAPSEKN